TAERLEHAHRWRERRARGAPARKDVDAPRGPCPISRGHDREHDEEIGNVSHVTAPVWRCRIGREAGGAGDARHTIAQITSPPAAQTSSRRCRIRPNANPALGARPSAAKIAVLPPSWTPSLAGTTKSTPSTVADNVSMARIVDGDRSSPSERQMR